MITFHKEIGAIHRLATDFPHAALNTTIQEFIIKLDKQAEFYKVYTNSHYLFIYLADDTRIDVAI